MTLKDELFGPDKEDVYKQLASDLNGKFICGDFYNPIKVEVPFKNWTITIDTNVTKDFNVGSSNPYGDSEYTRIRVPFIKTGNFQIAITNANTFDSITKLFGAKDIIIGDQKFDDLFTIKGNDEIKVKLLFSNSLIRHLLIEIKKINLVIREQEGFLGTQLPETVNELFFKAKDVILETEKLKLLVQLFSEILEELHNIGCAKNDNPNINLTY